MKNEIGKTISELKQPHLAIVKSIAEWNKPLSIQPAKEKQKEKKQKKEKQKKEKEKSVFRKWNLPEQQDGYIKARHIDPL